MEGTPPAGRTQRLCPNSSRLIHSAPGRSSEVAVRFREPANRKRELTVSRHVNVPGCCAAVITALVTSCAPSALPQQVLPAATSISVGQSVWTNVSVATLWVLPSSPRAVDAPALANPVDIRGWLAAMSTAVRRDLAGRVETQTLYGERLLVTGVRS